MSMRGDDCSTTSTSLVRTSQQRKRRHDANCSSDAEKKGSLLDHVLEAHKKRRSGDSFICDGKIESSQKQPTVKLRDDNYGGTFKAESSQKQRPFKLRKLRSGTGSFHQNRTNDTVHTSIELCALMRTIVDTEFFQRLRKLKQLGVTEHVYVNATHNRFEHSLGVAHLCHRRTQNLKQCQPQLGITEKDVMCVAIAGLCHDLGHGPFSHIYDGQFLSQVREKERLREIGDKSKIPALPVNWAHEEASLMMIDAILASHGMEIDKNCLDKPLKQIGDGLDARYYGLPPLSVDDTEPFAPDRVLTSRDWIFIKECIMGQPLDDASQYVGRPHLEFLYDIVSNPHSGMDDDKVDYFARDQKQCHNTSGDSFHMFSKDAFVAWGKCAKPEKCFRCKHLVADKKMGCRNEVDDETKSLTLNPRMLNNCNSENDPRKLHLMICYPDKLLIKSMDFFKTRFRLHEEIYSHRKAKGAEYMICDILLKADPHHRIKTSNPENFPNGLPISRAMLDPESYCNLNDSILDILKSSTNPGLKEAQDLIKRFSRRDFYSYVTKEEINDTNRKQLWEKDKNQIISELCNNKWHHDNCGKKLSLNPEDIIIEKLEIHHGRKEVNPVDCMRFLPKRDLHLLNAKVENLPEAKCAKESDYFCHIPRTFLKQTLRVYSRVSEKVDLLLHTFNQWLEYSIAGDDAPNSIVVEEHDGNNIYEGDNILEPVSISQLSQTPLKEEHENNNNFSEVSMEARADFYDEYNLPSSQANRFRKGL
mmetsp:Transcript_27966/g.32248  ORF Transcript_27966/g.32248 Transcript_27966/m.32248 type:complete len:759 (-) Transcript_27966:278-2554(-)